MRERTRHRLTGTLFLLALAIVFVPMLFDRDDAAPVQLSPVDQGYVPPLVEGLDQAPESDFEAQVQELREKADAEGFHRQTKTKIGEPVLSEADDQTDAWAVQVGAFGGADKARAFRDDLRADGYESFISSYKPPQGGVLSRVAVGPLLDRERAGALSDELSAKYEVEARLMAFGN